MTAIQMIALACTFDLPVTNVSDHDEVKDVHRFELSEGHGQ